MERSVGRSEVHSFDYRAIQAVEVEIQIGKTGLRTSQILGMVAISQWAVVVIGFQREMGRRRRRGGRGGPPRLKCTECLQSLRYTTLLARTGL